MLYVGIIALFIICYIIDEGSTYSKLILSSGIVAITCLILNLIMDWDFLILLAKLCAAGAILLILFIVISKIFGD